MHLNGFSRSMGNVLDALSEDYLGWTFPPPHQAIANAQWSPDDPNASVYCRRCGDSVGPGEATEQGCGTCREGGELSGGLADGVVRLGPYVDVLQAWILATKYKHWSEMGDALGRLLGRQVRRAAMIDPARTIVVPMPMPWQRRWHRGINHAAVIAAGVAHELRAPMVSILAKRNGPPQVNLPPSERRRAGGRNLRIRKRFGAWNIQGLHVLLVDDVRTTGATLKAGARLLATLKPERIICGVLAVSDSRARRARAQQLQHLQA